MDTSVVFEKKRIEILNVPIDIVPPEALEPLLTGMLSNNEFNQIVLLRLKDLMRARRNHEFRGTLQRAALVIPISKSLVGGVAFLKKGKASRYMPFDFIIRLLGILEKNAGSVYLLSSTPKELQKTEHNLKASFPGLRVVGRYNGFFPKTAVEDIILAIKKSSPSLLLAGRGVKGKDLWLAANRSNFNPGIFPVSIFIKLHYTAVDCFCFSAQNNGVFLSGCESYK